MRFYTLLFVFLIDACVAAPTGVTEREVKAVAPLWHHTAKHYPKTADSTVDGEWVNYDYQLELYQSDSQIVAVIGDIQVINRDWKTGDVKMLYAAETGEGLYLMGNREPVQATFTINASGGLEVAVRNNAEVFAFHRKSKPF